MIARAENGKTAAHLAVELRPDVVLMDLSMPHLDGFDATTRILEEAPETAIVVLTGSNDPADVERARTAGAAAYVTKDRILAGLAAAIRSAARRG